jgi:hypothetical protein
MRAYTNETGGILKKGTKSGGAKQHDEHRCHIIKVVFGHQL